MTRLLAALAVACAAAQAAPDTTIETVLTHSGLTAGLPDGTALNVRGTRLLGGDNVVRAEVLAERKFGDRGGIVGVGGSSGLTDAMFATINLAAGTGGPNWANTRIDLGLNVKLGAQRETIVGATLYDARYDQGRRDQGVSLGVVAYQLAPLVLQGGVIVNVSTPGSVRSAMFNAAATWGRDGRQLFVLRGAHGRESYQAIGDSRAIADFRSSLVAFSWRRWMAPGAGLALQAEHYHNPTYERLSLGLAVFAQF